MAKADPCDGSNVDIEAPKKASNPWPTCIVKSHGKPDRIALNPMFFPAYRWDCN